MQPEVITIPVWIMQTGLAILVSAVVSFATTYWLKNVDFKNEYYKLLIGKRLDAYAFIEAQIAVLKTSLISSVDGKPYHAMFAYGIGEAYKFQENLHLAQSYSMWISNETIGVMTRLNHLLLQETVNLTEETTKEELIDIGKKLHPQIALLREELELAVKKDMKDLHKLSSFLNDRRKKGFSLIWLKRK